MTAVPDASKSVPEDPPPRMRGVELSDLEATTLLDQELFERDSYSYTVMRQFYDLYSRHFLVIDDGKGIQGYVLAGTAVDGNSCVLGLGITRDRRGRGLGRRLMLRVLDLLRADGVHTVRLSVAPENDTAIDLYKSLDFTTEGDLQKDYFGPGGDRYVMVRQL